MAKPEPFDLMTDAPDQGAVASRLLVAIERISEQLDYLIDQGAQASTDRQAQHDALIIAIGDINVL